MSEQIFRGFDEFNDFEKLKQEKISDEFYENNSTIPNGCYVNYGADLDGCSRQENQGCNGCILYRGGEDVDR